MRFLSEGGFSIQSFNIFIFVLCVVFTALWLSPALAKRYKALTEDNVSQFVEEATELTSGNSDKSIDKIVAFLDKHLHKKARFKSTMAYVLPGFPPQNSALALDKQDYIDSIKDSHNALEDHHSEVNIKSIEIIGNGKQALVMTEALETGTMVVPVPDEGDQRIPVEGFTECNQIIHLTKGVIQMYNAVCDTQIEFVGEY